MDDLSPTCKRGGQKGTECPFCTSCCQVANYNDQYANVAYYGITYCERLQQSE